MLDEKALTRIATKELVSIFGKEYLRSNYRNTCRAWGMIADHTYMLFVGIKDSEDLPDREANGHGWVVYGKVLVDALTGEIKSTEYSLE